MILETFMGQDSRSLMMKELRPADVHDAELLGLSHDKDKVTLTLHCLTQSGVPFMLVFHQVKAWRLSEFQDQNVLAQILEWDGPAWLNENADDYYFADMRSSVNDGNCVFDIESSVGMDGAVVASRAVFETGVI